MLLRSSPGLHYPITVTELHRRRDEDVARSAVLLSYAYKSKVTEGNKYGDEIEVERTYPARIEAPIDGVVRSWKVKKGDVIGHSGVPLVEIEEPCLHEVQFAGLCANCGKDTTERDYLTGVPDTERATVMKVHGHTALRISADEAKRLEQDDKKRLLGSKKLNMVVDLDQTVIQATVDPTVADWQRDTNNPNYEAVKDVQAFQLIDDGPGGNGCWYYIKMRPGLQDFLQEMCKLYELHIYTMGTRAYAHNVAKIIDPDRKIFGDRILTRDENGSLDKKSLARIFPVSTKMVVIIDDRADVWGWSGHLLKVRPYDFFVGVGDINSAFLPKTQPIPKPIDAPSSATTEKTDFANENGTVEAEEQQIGDTTMNGADGTAGTDGTMSAIEQQLINIGSRDDPNLVQEQASHQDEVIAAQIADRPLLQKQLLLEKADEEQEKVEREKAVDRDQEEVHLVHHEHRHLLHDDDRELEYLGSHLREVHQKFFEEYERRSAGSTGGRLAEIKGGKDAKKTPLDDDSLIPDVKDLLGERKSTVLNGTHVVFSGIVPQNVNIFMSDIGQWAQSFGARIYQNINKRTTHLIAAPNRRTVKVKKAARYSHIKIVNAGWLTEAFSTWKKADETPYLISIDSDDVAPHEGPGPGSPLEELEDGDFLSAEDDDAGMTEEPTPDESEFENPDISRDEWGAMHDDLEDFMNESGDEDESRESDSDSVRSDTENVPPDGLKVNGSRKRRRDDSSAEPSDNEDPDASNGVSRLQIRKKRAFQRVTSLTNMTVPDAKASGLPSPDTTGPEETMDDENAKLGGGDVAAAPLDDDESDDGFEAEMMAELASDDDD